MNLFGENTDKAKDLFSKMIEFEKSKLVNGIQSEKKVKAKAKGSHRFRLTEEEVALFAEAVKSAKTKFEHEDTYFEKNATGRKEYEELIWRECLDDMEVD